MDSLKQFSGQQVQSINDAMLLIRSIEDLAGIGTCEVNLVTDKYYFSEGMFKLLGEDPYSFEPNPEFIDARSDPDDIAGVHRVHEQAAHDKQSYHYIRRLRRKDGTWITVESHGKVIADNQGNAVKLFEVVQEITGKNKAGDEPEENKNLLRSTLDSSRDMIQVFQAVRNEASEIIDFKWILNNHISRKYYGNVIGKSLLQHSPGVVQEGIFQKFKEVTETGIPQQYERHYEHEQFNGWFYQSVVRLNDGVATTTSDISDRKKAEQELLESKNQADRGNALLGSVLENTSGSIMLLEPVRDNSNNIVDLEYLFINTQAQKSVNRVSLAGKWFLQEFPQAAFLFNKYVEVYNSGNSWSDEVQLDVDGVAVWAKVFARRVDGNILVTYMDITDRKKAEQELNITKERLQATLDSSLFVIQAFEAVRDKSGKIIDFTWVMNNRKGIEQNGDVIGKSLLQKNPGVIATGLFEKFVQVTETGISIDQEQFYDCEQFDGWFHQTLVKMGDGFVMSTENITERRRTEQEILRLKDEIAQVATEKYHTLINNLEDGFCIVEAIVNDNNEVLDYRFLEANAVFEKHMGLFGAVGKTVSELHLAHKLTWLQACGEVAKSRRPIHFENEASSLKTGIWFDLFAFPYGLVGSNQAAILFSDITDRKRAEESLRQSQENLSALFTAMPVGVALIDLEGKVIIANAEMQRFLPTGIIPSKDRDRAHCWKGFYPDGKVLEISNYPGQKALKGETDGPTDFLYTDDEGAEIWTRVNYLPITDINGKVNRFVCVITDIDGLKRNAEALRQSEAHFRAITSLVPALLWQVNADGGTSFCNPRWQEYTGQRDHEFLGECWLDSWLKVIHPADKAHSAEVLKETFAKQKEVTIQPRIRRYDGAYRWFQVRHVPIKDERGQLIQWFGAATEIHEQKLAEEQLKEFNTLLENQVAERTEELRKSRDMLRSIFDITLFGMFIAKAIRDTDGTIADFQIEMHNKQFEQETGRTDLVGKLYAKEYPGVISSGVFEKMRTVVDSGHPEVTELFYPYEGFNKWFSVMFVKFKDGVVATNLDITERKQAEQKLIENLANLKLAEDLASIGSWEYDIESQTLYWSEGMYRLYELEQGDEIFPEIYLQFTDPGEKDKVGEMIRTIRSEFHPFKTEFIAQIRSRRKSIYMKAIPYADREGKTIKVLGIDMDITERKSGEQKLRRAEEEKEKAILNAVMETQEEERRRIAEALHNEFGQLLVATKLQVQGKGLQAEKTLDSAIHLVRNISHELMPSILHDFGLQVALEDLFDAKLSDIKVKYSLKLRGLTKRLSQADEIAVFRIVQEILNNVVKHSQATEVAAEINRQDHHIVIQIADNGIGIGDAGPKSSKRSFGLDYLSNRVHLHQGTMKLNSEPGKGTSFEIVLPL